MSRRKSQIFSFDFVASVIVFLIFFTLFFLVYSQLKIDTQEAEILRDAQNTAAAFSDELVGTRGVPEDWTNETAVTIGLASEEGVISSEKVKSLGNMTYSSSRTKLILNQFQFFLNISSISGRQIFVYGAPPLQNATAVIPIRRMVLYDNGTRELCVLLGVIWK